MALISISSVSIVSGLRIAALALHIVAIATLSRGDRECTGRRIVIPEAAAGQKPTCGDLSFQFPA